MPDDTLSAREIALKFGLKRHGREWRGDCPACGYKGGLTVNEKAGRALWWCANCRDQEAVTKALFGDAPAPRAGGGDHGVTGMGGDRATAVAHLLSLALPAQGSPVAAYLKGRGLALPPEPVLRFLPHAKHPSGARFPCMLAQIADAAGIVVALHRTFLAAGGAGKCGRDPERMTLGPVWGGAVRLFPAGPKLVVGEGIETTLSAAVMLDAPAWAATSAGNLASGIVLPDSVLEVIIAVDSDKPGRDAARDAAARWKAQGRSVKIAQPTREGLDFNDLLKAKLGLG